MVLRRTFRSWLGHWLTSVALAVAVFLALRPFSEDALFRTLDHLGNDAVVRAYSGGVQPAHEVVLIDLGPEPTIDGLAEVLRTIGRMRPASVGLDVTLADLPAASNGGLDGRIARLSEALAAVGTPVAMPLVNRQLARVVAGTVEDASVELPVDDDGEVRDVRACAQTLRDRELVRLRTLAEAVVVRPWRECDGGEAMPILFAAAAGPQVWRDGILILQKEMLTENAARMWDAYVIVGDLGSGSRSDFFATPRGESPGSLLHAQSVWTLATHSMLEANGRRWAPPPVVVELGFAALAGAVFAGFATGRGGRHEIVGAVGALVRLGWGMAGLGVSLATLLLLGWLWTEIAVVVMRDGVVLGAASAMFGSILETLIHIGEDLIGPLHWAIARGVNRALPMAVATVLCAAAGVADAAAGDRCAYRIEAVGGGGGRLESVPPGAHQGDTWQPFERLQIAEGTTLRIVPQGGGETMVVAARAGVSTFIVPPCGASSVWRAFWDTLNARDSRQAVGATTLYRGFGDAEAAVRSGPLRAVLNLAPGCGVVAGSVGLAFAWAGGRPPFTVSVEDVRNGRVLGQAHTDRQSLWLPGWEAPTENFSITIRDGVGEKLRLALRVLTAPVLADRSVADAIELYATAPAYRLEALRRLSLRAVDGDEVADHAVRLIEEGGGS